MSKFTRFKGLIIAAVLLVATTACTDYRQIPVSTVGKVVTESGLSKETYNAGTRDIGKNWIAPANTLVLLDTSVELIPLKLTILLNDTQEIGIELLVKTQLDLADKDGIDAMFGMITPDRAGDKTLKIPLTKVYKKLGEDLARRTLVEVITPHTLESFQKNRKAINDKIEEIIELRFKNTPLKLYTASINDVAYPEKYIDAANKIKTEEMSVALKVAEEKAKRAKLLEEEATIVIEKRVRVNKADVLRLENLKVIAGISPMLLEYKKLELESQRIAVDLEIAKNSGKSGNTVYYPIGQKPNYIDTLMGQKK